MKEASDSQSLNGRKPTISYSDNGMHVEERLVIKCY